MRNLTTEERASVTSYVEARYSHWTHSQRRKRRSDIIKRLLAETDENIEQYVQKVNDCLERSNIT